VIARVIARMAFEIVVVVSPSSLFKTPAEILAACTENLPRTVS
jgi:hypothetical protein